MSGFSEQEPVNLLACDGGGIRGVSELVILDELMKTVQKKDNRAEVPKPCEFFHLIGGTSTGGLIAIMLGRLEMSTADALRAYDSFARDIFSKHRLSIVEKYRAQALEETVRRLVQEQGRGELLRDGRPLSARGRAFVCAMPERRHRETVRLRTYETGDDGGDRHKGVRIWEAARATTAATTFFRPMVLRGDGGEEEEEEEEERLVDAALGTNNPVEVCLEEAPKLFGTRRPLGCVVSLGTGSRAVEMRAHGSRRLIDQTKYLLSALMLMKEIGTDSEREHQRMQTRYREYENTYFRFSVDGGAQGISLSDWQKIGELKTRTGAYLQIPEVRKNIDNLADVLLNRISPSGLTLAHGGSLDKDTTIPMQQRFIRRGKSSNTFTGRDSVLKRLDEYFGPREAGDTRRREFQLHGMGGVGKTQIALKFTERNDRRFHHIMWVDATDPVTIEQSFQDIATNILGPEERKQAARDVRHWLQRTDDEWLLVFDNAPDSGLGAYLPDGDRGNVLYTTRHPNMEPRLRAECIATVREMGDRDAVRLLLLSAQMAEGEANRGLARAVVRELGFLPLAIDQAGAYVHMAPCSLDRYLNLLKQQKGALLREPRFKGGDQARHVAVYASFNISYHAIKACADKKGDMDRVKDANMALKILRLICFYHNEGFLQRIVERAARYRHSARKNILVPLGAGNVELEELVSTIDADISPEAPQGRAWISEPWARGMAFLHEYSLLQLDSSVGHSNMHVLVHDWARDRMGDTERQEWGLAARCLLMDSLTLIKTEYADIVSRRDAVPHLRVLLEHVYLEHGEKELETEYQTKMGVVFQEAHDFAAAKTAFRRALEHRKRERGLLDRGTFATMVRLSELYMDQGRYAKAANILFEVVDRRRLLYREMRWEATQESGSNAQSVSSETEMFYSEELLDDYCILNDTLALGIALLHLDAKSDVEKILLGLITWSKKRHGVDGELTRKFQRIRAHFLLKDSLETQEDTGGEAIEAARERLGNVMAELGPDHHDTISAKTTLARLLASHGAFLEALVYFEQAWRWTERVHGVYSIQSVGAGCAFVKVLLEDGRPYEAYRMFELAIRVYERTLGRLHPKTLEAYYDLGNCHASKADFKKAIEAFEVCAWGRRAALGPDHRLTQATEAYLQTWKTSEEMIPDWGRARINNRAVEASKMILQDDAPQWMKDWTPAPEEAEGPYDIVPTKTNFNGFLVYRYELVELVQPPTPEVTLPTGYEDDHKEGSDSEA